MRLRVGVQAPAVATGMLALALASTSAHIDRGLRSAVDSVQLVPHPSIQQEINDAGEEARQLRDDYMTM